MGNLPGKSSIEPLEGWEPNSAYGFQQLDASPWGRLVRLEVVATWLGQRLPRNSVVYAIGSALVANDGDAAGWLWVLNAHDFPTPLMRAGVLNRDAVDFWQFLNDLEFDSTPEDVARAIADEFDDVWPGLADPATDTQWAMQRAIAENRRLQSIQTAQPARKELYRRDTSFDSDSRRYAMQRLGKLALPVPKAHELWGWGRVVAVVAQPDTVAETTPAPAIETQDVTDWPSLVRYRLQFASLAAQKRQGWLPGHVEILAARLHEDHQARGRGALDRLAGELGLTRSTVGELLKKRGFNQATGEKQQAPATPWSGAGGRGGKAA
ncbi:hypothetical protein N5J23_08135 [Comamonas aquatica]|uniref:Uncharacterized protein n=1 Tax=Comamonas aquatica TaxID=225991 RepID=A0AA42HQ21_9BURK|nr:hypothetical protein [Comamonas aquatica]MDH0362529.1 hypothetical protein [Comamonas aquatica]MDH2005513.1 hypothetical protein [Comamonas aquatica]